MNFDFQTTQRFTIWKIKLNPIELFKKNMPIFLELFLDLNSTLGSCMQSRLKIPNDKASDSSFLMSLFWRMFYMISQRIPSRTSPQPPSLSCGLHWLVYLPVWLLTHALCFLGSPLPKWLSLRFLIQGLILGVPKLGQVVSLYLQI